jgi:molecular chaperone DnaK
MPKVQAVVKKFFGKEPHKSVNPMKSALGAAIQAGVLMGDYRRFIVDVTPTLGLETLGKYQHR